MISSFDSNFSISPSYIIDVGYNNKVDLPIPIDENLSEILISGGVLVLDLPTLDTQYEPFYDDGTYSYEIVDIMISGGVDGEEVNNIISDN